MGQHEEVILLGTTIGLLAYTDDLKLITEEHNVTVQSAGRDISKNRLTRQYGQDEI